MRRIVALSACLLIAAALTGCGQRLAIDAAPRPAGVAITEASEPAGTMALQPSASATEAPAQILARSSQPSPVPEDEPSIRPTFSGRHHNTGRIKVTVARPCIGVGQPQQVRVQTPGLSSVAAVVAYSDADAHGTMTAGSTEPGGLYVWSFVIPPDVPPGEATLLVTASNQDWGTETADVRFIVVRDGGECA